MIAALPHGRAGAFDDAAKRSTGFDDVAGRYTVLLQGRPRAVSAKPQNVVLAPERQEAKSRSTANHVPTVPVEDQVATSAIFSAAADGDGFTFLKKTEKQASHKSHKSKKKKKGKR